LDEARHQVLRARDHCAAASDRWAEAWWSGELSLIECYRSSLGAAEEAGRHVQAIAVMVQDVELGGRADEVLAMTHFAGGDFKAAAGLATTAFDEYRAVNVPDGQAFLRNLQGMIALSLGQLQQADAAFQDTRDWGRQLGIPRLVGIGELHLALVRYRQGDLSDAVMHASEAERELSRAGHPAAAAATGVHRATFGLSQADAAAGARGLLDYARCAKDDADLHPYEYWVMEAHRLAAESGESELVAECRGFAPAAKSPSPQY